MSNSTVEDFENAIAIALNQFKRRLEQQELFQVQNDLLKGLQKEIASIGFCDSEDIKDLSEQYQSFDTQLRESGRTYENIVDEKTLVDTYSAFEKFLFDCFCAIYTFFPKFLGAKIDVDIYDLFIDGDVELCKKNVIELKVKKFIQSGNIKEILDGFKSNFAIKDMKSNISDNDKDYLYEISLIRNLIIHNNSVVNRVHMELVKKMLKNRNKYQLIEGNTIFNVLQYLVSDIKEITMRVCQKTTETLINSANQLENYHNNL